MKITKIKLKDFHQFKDVTLDLTYPAGHEKAGQPLDKVCFIGQSGTGKTTLLELIPKFLFLYDTKLIERIGEKAIYDKIMMSIQFGLEDKYEADISYGLQVDNQADSASRLWEGRINGKERGGNLIRENYKREWINNIASKLIYFPANLKFDIDTKTKNELDENEIIDFSKSDVSIVWKIILDSIKKYREQELRIRQDISKTVEQSSNDLNTIKKALEKLEIWQNEEFNPVKDVADNCLDELLENFKLKVKTSWTFSVTENIDFIELENYNSNEIPRDLWSTGTKQVVLSALPLYLLKPKHTAILFDEPERSLYPDLQRIIIDFYSSLTENCQFFYSTHSPIIASSFEPWEIVELKFNNEGHIYRELYYQGENHVDNYKFNPRYMRWDDILQRIFDMADDGSPERKGKLDELATLHVKYKKLDKKNATDSKEAQDLLEEIATLSKELSYWD